MRTHWIASPCQNALSRWSYARPRRNGRVRELVHHTLGTGRGKDDQGTPYTVAHATRTGPSVCTDGITAIDSCSANLLPPSSLVLDSRAAGGGRVQRQTACRWAVVRRIVVVVRDEGATHGVLVEGHPFSIGKSCGWQYKSARLGLVSVNCAAFYRG